MIFTCWQTSRAIIYWIVDKISSRSLNVTGTGPEIYKRGAWLICAIVTNNAITLDYNHVGGGGANNCTIKISPMRACRVCVIYISHCYFSSLGYCILVAQGIHTLSQKLTKSTSRQRHIAISLTLLLVAVFSLKTVDRNKVWATRESLFK